MRIGQNPAKFVQTVAKPERITVAVLNYIPFQSGFYAEALDVLKHCLASARTDAGLPFDRVAPATSRQGVASVVPDQCVIAPSANGGPDQRAAGCRSIARRASDRCHRRNTDRAGGWPSAETVDRRRPGAARRAGNARRRARTRAVRAGRPHRSSAR